MGGAEKMDRRTVLHFMAAAGLASCTPKPANPSNMKIVIVGAGIIGASIAYHLTKLGASVTIIDKVGPATQTSQGTFAWINASWAKQPKFYHALNQDGVTTWKTLQSDLGIPIKWGGSLEWFETEARQEKLADQIKEQALWGEPASMLPVERLIQMEPKVNFTGVGSAAFSGNDGALDPVDATKALLKAAQSKGAILKYPCELLNIQMSNGGIESVDTNLGKIAADKVILATGAEPDIAKTFAEIELPQRSTPGVIAVTKPMPPLLNRLIIAPGVHMHQREDGRIVLGEQEGAPKTQAHAMRLKHRPTTFPSPEYSEQHFRQILSIAETFVPEIGSAELENAFIGWRPLPLDGHPVLGFSPKRSDVYLSVMHSGVSLAPVIGQLVAHEVLTGELLERLSKYRPDRDFKSVKRY